MKPFLTFLFALSAFYMITSLPTFASYDFNFANEDIHTTCRRLIKDILFRKLPVDSLAELALDFVDGSDPHSSKQFIKESDTQDLPVWGLNLVFTEADFNIFDIKRLAPSVTHLTIQGKSYTDKAFEINGNTAPMPKLRSLALLHEANITDRTLTAISALSLRHLELWGKFSDEVLEDNKYNNLTHIGLHSNTLSGKSLKNKPSLTHLALEGKKFSNQDFKDRPPLVHIKLIGDQFSDEAFKALDNPLSVKRLELIRGKYSDKALQNMRNLTHLKLDGQYGKGFSDKALEDKPFITHLSICGSKFSNEALQDKYNLIEVSLSFTGLSDEALKNARFLRNVMIRGNRFTPEFAKNKEMLENICIIQEDAIENEEDVVKLIKNPDNIKYFEFIKEP